MAWNHQGAGNGALLASHSITISGILNIDKPPGMTSHDVVARIRRASGQRRVGHAGTLDPSATGVLLVCIGKATRVTEYLVNDHKRYRAKVHLGITTDTYDSEGTVISEKDYSDLEASDVASALQSFVGRVQQVPPMYSAVKVRGRRLYRLARQGISVKRDPRWIEIHEIVLLNWSPPSALFEVECSKGTYVRSLANDLGIMLGCGAHLEELVRLSSGPFDLRDAVPLERAERSFDDGSWRQLLLPSDTALLGFPAVNLGPDATRRVANGLQIAISVETEQQLLRAYDSFGDFVALLQPGTKPGSWRPRKVFKEWGLPSDTQAGGSLTGDQNARAE
jgi:tRNA pseudouridine55 synthase